MVRMVKHYEWKQKLARPSVSMPGAWYPDERFLRLHLVRKGLPKPRDYQEAVMQAAHVLATVTVPPGDQMGTDSGAGEGEGDHTLWGVLYDLTNARLYLRTADNQNLQRFDLADLDLRPGAPPVSLSLGRGNGLPWAHNATGSLKRLAA
jgi:penicillin V acylase-like amidase (Ntn superfamily)